MTRQLVIVPDGSPASSRPVHGLPEKRSLFALPRRPPNSALSAIEPPPIPPVWRPWASSSALRPRRPAIETKTSEHPHSSRENVCSREPPSADTVALGKGSAKVVQMGVGDLDILSSWKSKTYTGDSGRARRFLVETLLAPRFSAPTRPQQVPWAPAFWSVPVPRQAKKPSLGGRPGRV